MNHRVIVTWPRANGHITGVAPNARAGLQAAVSVLSSKWSVAILDELSGGTRRFNELLRNIDGISRRMLVATLRRLESDGLIERRVYPDVPVRVEYDLTPAGADLLTALAPLAGWGLAHRPAA
jgi:DNA-binding HxlR family transcriptional regulator